MVARHVVLYLALTGLNVGLVVMSGPGRDRPAAPVLAAASPQLPGQPNATHAPPRIEQTRLAQR